MSKTYYPFHAVEKTEAVLTDNGYEATLTLHNNAESVNLSDDPNQSALASVIGTSREVTIVTDDSRPAPRIVGVDNVSIWEGETFDPMAGVSATDWEGNTVPVTYSGTVDPSTPGEYTLVYTAVDAEGRQAKRTRRVTVKELEAPRFTGITPIRVKQGGNIDLEAGVKAWLGDTEISYTYAPTTVVKCDIGTTTVTYTATGNGKTTTVDREVTVTESALPTITGNNPMTVFVNTEVDPTLGLIGKDDNNNVIPVVLDETLCTLTMTVQGADTTADYLEDAVVTLDEPTVADPYIFRGWYDNPSYTGTPITSITMDSNKHIYARIVRQFTLTKRVLGEDTTEKYDEGYNAILQDPTITEERKRFVAWYDNAEYTGSPIASITMNANKTVYAKVLDQVAYAKVDNGKLILFTDDEGKYDSDSSVYKNWETSTSTTPVWSGATFTEVEIQDVIKPATMTSWFDGQKYSGLSNITAFRGMNKIDLTGCRTVNYTFRGQQVEQTLDLSGWDVSNTSAWSNTFYGSNFTAINMMGWNVNAMSRVSATFKGCQKLTTIYADWSLTRLPVEDFFDACDLLVGGNGTAYSTAGVKDTSYARPDGGASSPGYFTIL